MKKQLFYLVAFLLIVFVACQKELSFETGNAPGTATLQADINGDCLPKTVNGSYEVGVPLVTTVNTISVDVNVLATGSYTITTDTVNGFYFNSSGIFTNLGTNTITLRGIGTPFTAGTFNFKVNLDTFYCDIQVTVLPAGAGGPADFTLEGAPNTCTNANVQGTYVLNTALSGSNQVVLNVNVITVGTYNITTTFQGMTFSASGAFGTTGATTVTLQGSGTPTTAGTNTVPITVGSSTCSFDVTVESAATGTLGGSPGACTPATVNGTYTVGTALDASNTVGIQLTIATIGAYNITTDTVAGIYFSASGNAAATGVLPLTLNGGGTPTASGMQTFTVSFGSSTCTFIVDIQPAAPLSNDYFPRTANSNWSYEFDDDPNDTLYRTAITATHSAIGNTYNIFMGNDGTGLDSSGYYRMTSTPGDYYEWFDAGGFIGYDNPLWAEYVMLKDDQPAATNWKTPITGFPGTVSGNPLNLRFSYTILQKDVPISVTTSLGTQNYQNVIVVEEKIEVEVSPGVWQDATATLDFYGKSYYARGIGLIKYEELDASDQVTFLMELRRYVVL
ncbi:MAG TPA: hypothetical protein PLU37_05750 [Chitinophagaceae bacterium]|nr:hypothetical protein [Chitinophagales bacterium]HPG11015.1 hypothetical protein [Chitinophagaceae bacterium]